MNFDLADMFILVSPESVAVVVLMGFITGFFTVRGVDPMTVFWAMLRIGLPFFLMMMLLRFVEGVERYESWLGAAFLFVLYAVGTAIGFRLRRERGGTLL